MKRFEFVGLDQCYYKETLENGLTVYFVPYKNKNNYSMHYVTKYGSIDTSFTPYEEQDEITVPAGIAHFLEHKKFEVEDGMDPFSFAAKSGTDCNAATYTNYTRYLFEGNKNFEENLDYLLTFVHTPYFTKENVEKEKGIIVEELSQYQDMVESKLENCIKEGLLAVDPMRVDIGGTEESVRRITKEDLDITYKTFYQPSNMFLVITGSFDPDVAIKVVKNNKALNHAPTNFEITRKIYDEPQDVHSKLTEIEFNTTTTKMAYSIKIDTETLEIKDKFLIHIYFSLMLSMLFGISSDFRERMKKKELYTSFYYNKEQAGKYLLISFIAETETPDELMYEIEQELNRMNLKEEELERIKKVWISSEVMMIDNINVTLDNIVYDVIEYGDIISNKNDIYKSLNHKDLVDLMKNIDLSHISKVIIHPKSK